MVLYIVANALIILISAGACMYSILCADPVFQDWFEEKIYNIKMKRIRKKQEKNAEMWEEFHNNLNKKNKERHMDG